MRTLKLQEGIIYGPVDSRRLGRSLGINLFPTTYKLCSFDCIYCHYGRTQLKTNRPEEALLPGIDEVLSSVEEALKSHPDIDYITFSGNDEPTLHPRFPDIVAGVHRLKEHCRPGVRMAILSNSSTAHFLRAREALDYFDEPIMKLDAGDWELLARINRLTPEVELDTILEGLISLSKITI